MRLIVLFCTICLVSAAGCTKTIPDTDLEASRLRARVLAHASSPTIPDWVLPGPPCIRSNDLVLTKVFVSGLDSLAAAERLALRETGVQSSLEIRRWIVSVSQVSNIGVDSVWCSNHARIVARYWEAWRPETARERRFTLYLQAAFSRSRLLQALGKKARLVYGTNALPPSLAAFLTN